MSAAASTYASEHCPTLKADFARRQLAEWASSTPFTIANGGDGYDKAKHVPVLTLSEDGGSFTIVVGNGNEENGVWHPQVASDDPDVVHFVSHIYDGNVIFMRTLNPQAGEPATVTGLVPEGITALTPFEFCNKHGLWMGDTVSTGGVEQTDRIITCSESDALQWVEGAWTSLKADFERQQRNTFGSDAPYTETDSEKHTPFITVNGDGTASILVGSVDGGIHPMVGSADGVEEPHWITEVFIVDDQDNFITLKALDPTGVDQAAIAFSLPENSLSVTAYIWCNIHGLYVGPTVNITSTDSIQETAGSDEVQETAGSDEAEDKSNSASGILATSSLSAVAALVALAM
ncbi:hypothetical protein ACHAWX_005957 [Stephanocyclus meneghinianus]